MRGTSASDYEQRLQREIEGRVEEMERPGYVFPRRFSRGDALLWAVVAAGSLALVLLGAWL